MAQAAIANQDLGLPFTSSTLPMPESLDSVLPKASSSASSDALEIARLGVSMAQAKAALLFKLIKSTLTTSFSFVNWQSRWG